MRDKNFGMCLVVVLLLRLCVERGRQRDLRQFLVSLREFRLCLLGTMCVCVCVYMTLALACLVHTCQIITFNQNTRVLVPKT